MREMIVVFVGGGIGSILRWALGRVMAHLFVTPFPLGTLSVNMLACFVLGLVIPMADFKFFSPTSRIFLATGLCGGFSTFSTFSAESIALYQQGNSIFAALYILGSIVLGILATIAGMWLAGRY